MSLYEYESPTGVSINQNISFNVAQITDATYEPGSEDVTVKTSSGDTKILEFGAANLAEQAYFDIRDLIAVL